MDLFEFEGKQYFARFGIPVLDGEHVTSASEAVTAASRMGFPAVIKAQVRIGGRGKAGGIAVVHDADETFGEASRILSLNIGGHDVDSLLIEPAVEIAHEWYVAISLDRAERRYALMLSARGGVDIESVAKDSPGSIVTLHFGHRDELTLADVVELAHNAQIPKDAHEPVAQLVLWLRDCFIDGDAELVEVNPLVQTTGGEVLILDAKVSLDDNAAFRHPEWSQFARIARTAGETREERARAEGFSYVALDGSVGVIGNGAGMVMSTIDVIAQAGGKAANFLDVGGGASADVLTRAIDVVSSDPNVKSILINIFGGITRCDEVARGILNVQERLNIVQPLVVRLDGTHAAEGRALLASHYSSQLNAAENMQDAARKAVLLSDNQGGEGSVS